MHPRFRSGGIVENVIFDPYKNYIEKFQKIIRRSLQLLIKKCWSYRWLRENVRKKKVVSDSYYSIPALLSAVIIKKRWFILGPQNYGDIFSDTFKCLQKISLLLNFASSCCQVEIFSFPYKYFWPDYFNRFIYWDLFCEDLLEIRKVLFTRSPVDQVQKIQKNQSHRIENKLKRGQPKSLFFFRNYTLFIL